MSRLLDALAARSGTVCAVGAGGKKTILQLLASRHPGRVGITCTVPHALFPNSLGAAVVIATADEIVDEVLRAAARHRIVAFAHPSAKQNRYAGLAPRLIAEIQGVAGFDLLSVKADGARMRWVKAPGPGEPLVPDRATTVLPVVSARAIGEPLDERIAHRPERVAAITGAVLGQPLTPTHLGRLLAHERGALKNVGDAEVVPVIHMVDDRERESLAREAAQLALQRTDRFDRVALTSMHAADRLDCLVDVMQR